MAQTYVLNSHKPLSDATRRINVRGKFVRHDSRDDSMSFVYGYPNEKYEPYELQNQGVYDIPLSLAKYLNNNDMKISDGVPKCSFESIDSLEYFLDIQARLSDFVDAEKVV